MSEEKQAPETKKEDETKAAREHHTSDYRGRKRENLVL